MVSEPLPAPSRPGGPPAADPAGSPRVCMVVFMDYPLDPRVRREASALRYAGYEVDVYCLRQPQDPRSDTHDGVHIRRIMKAPRSKESLARYLLHTIAFTVVALAHIAIGAWRRGYALYQVHTMPDYLVFSCLAGRLAGRPVVLDLHDLSVELFSAKLRGKQRWLLPLVAWQEKLACNFADRLITTSEGFQQRLIARGQPANKITLVLNSADPRLFVYDDRRRFEPLEGKLRLLYHGSVAHRFGLHVAIAALQEVRTRFPQVTLDIYGRFDPTYKQALVALVKRLGLQAQVRMMGWRSPEDLPEIFRAADIAVVPYLRDDFMEIAISTKTFEYSAVGLPVVASRLPAMTDIYPEDAVAYVEPGDPGSLAAGIVALAEDPARRRRQSRVARAAQERLSGAVMAERYTRLIDSLLLRAPPCDRPGASAERQRAP